MEEILEYQCTFRPQRGTTDQIFIVRQILEKFYAHDIDLYLLFIDFKKAFDSIKKASRITAEFWGTQKIERFMKMTLEGAQAIVIVDVNISKSFAIRRGFRQGDVLSATLFNLALHKALKTWNKPT